MDFIKEFEKGVSAFPPGFKPKEILYRFKRPKYDQLLAYIHSKIAKKELNYYAIDGRVKSIELRIKAVTITIELKH